MDLNGVWSFELDPQDRGITDGWFNRPLIDQIHLPGALTAQGYGPLVSLETEWTGGIVDRSWYEDPRYEPYRKPGNVKIPFWLQPERHYQGAAWYQKSVDIPRGWLGQRITLFLEFPHWETRIWWDGKQTGTDLGLSVPHLYDLGTGLTAGAHTLTMRIDNRRVINVGENAHSISDHTQGNWNGVAGRLELRAGSPLWIEDVQVYPSVKDKIARVRIRLGNSTAYTGLGELTLRAEGYNTSRPHAAPPRSYPVNIEGKETTLEVDYPLGAEAATWDEFSPALYHLEAGLSAGTLSDRREVSFGLCEVGVQGTRLTLNGRPIFIRGTLECCIFPLTGYPPMEIGEWKRVIQIARSHGLNQLRFHSWCPPEAAFTAADELGFYFQVECASWANQGASVGEGDRLDTWLYEEGERITSLYGNHPSFIMMAYGNEPAGRVEEYLAKWVTYWKARDPRRLHTSGAGWPALPENDYHNIPKPRIHAWGAGLSSRINALPPETITDYRADVEVFKKPIVSHEIGQWCAYPNFTEAARYTGLLKARNFEIFHDSLVAHHMGDQAQEFLMASGKLQAMCYKEEIESALRTPGFAGFHLLDLHDFPGQGTALVGVLDPFWESKGYISADEYRRFCNATVPLARMKKRIWSSSEIFQAEVEVAHFGPAPLRNARAMWKLEGAGGSLLAEGSFGPADVPLDNAVWLGKMEVNLSAAAVPAKFRLVVGLEGTPYENDWDIWVYPAHLDPRLPQNVLVSERMDPTARQHLSSGGALLLMPGVGQLKSPVAMGFSSIFWNTAWTRNQPPHTLGILCDPAHPLFADFPTEYHSNWQWWEPLQGGTALVLDELPADLRPLVQPIDTWFENRRLGVLFEARVGKGKLVVCSLDLRTNLDNRLATRQLLHSLYQYMAEARFDPRVQLDADQVERLLARHSSGS